MLWLRCIQIYKHFNSVLIVNPLMKTTTMGTVKVYWLIKSIRLNNSIILCKHWRCDLSVDHFSERENHTFLTEKTWESHCHISLVLRSRKACSPWNAFCGTSFRGRKLKRFLIKDHRVRMQIFIERLCGEDWHENGKWENLARAGRERFESQR